MIPDSVLKRKLLPRAVVTDILKWIDDRQTLILLGSRQVGKTSIMHILIQHLATRDIPHENVILLDLEHLDHLKLVEAGPGSVLQFIRAEGADFSRVIYLFIDEIQYLFDPTKFLKLMVDHYPALSHNAGQKSANDARDEVKVKVICTGSSTLDIRRKFKDSLVGRKIVFEIFSLSFPEFLLFRGQKRLVDFRDSLGLTFSGKSGKPMVPPSASHVNELHDLMRAYCRYGGYPAVVLEASEEKKIALLDEIHSAYVLKDLSSLFTIENLNAFNQLVQMLALQAGNLLNMHSLAAEIGIPRNTLSRYLTILEQTFIVKRLKPFFRRRKREVIKMPKLYFLDLGLRNLILKQFGTINLRPDLGALVENFVFIQLNQSLRMLEELRFWRAKHGTEVDFIYERGDNLIPIEVKYQRIRRPTIPGGLKGYLAAYSAQQAIILTQSYFDRTLFGQTEVIFLPVFLIPPIPLQ